MQKFFLKIDFIAVEKVTGSASQTMRAGIYIAYSYMDLCPLNQPPPERVAFFVAIARLGKSLSS